MESTEIFCLHPALIQNTPAETLVILSGDEDKHVRRSVAFNRNTPVEILVVLSQDEEWEVRCGVAENSNTPVATLVVLGQDENKFVREYALQSISTNKH